MGIHTFSQTRWIKLHKWNWLCVKRPFIGNGFPSPFCCTLDPSHGACFQEVKKKNKQWLVPQICLHVHSELREKKVARMDRRSVWLCTILHCVWMYGPCVWCDCVCLCGRTWSNIPAGLRGSAVVRTIFPCAACHWWIKEDYSWGQKTLALATGRGQNQLDTDFFNESNLRKGDCDAELLFVN